MSSVQPAQPSVELHVDQNRVSVELNTDVYPREAIYGAAYIFIDRCFVFLDSTGDSQISVSLRNREKTDEEALQSLAGEFGNELLAQALRHMICDQHRPLLEAVVGRAVGAAAGPAGTVEAQPEFDLAELEALELEDEPFEDPLGIAVSWEDKYGKKRASKKDSADQKDGDSASTDEAAAS